EAAFADHVRLAEAARAYAHHAAHAAGAVAAPPAALPDWTDLLERQALVAPDPTAQPLVLELEAFARAVATGVASPGGRFDLATGEQGLAALEVAEDVRRALRERAARWP